MEDPERDVTPVTVEGIPPGPRPDPDRRVYRVVDLPPDLARMLLDQPMPDLEDYDYGQPDSAS